MDNDGRRQPFAFLGTFRALLLDLDGTLVDSTFAVEAAWREGCAKFGLPFSAMEPFVHGIPARQAIRMAAPAMPSQQREFLAQFVLAEMASPDHVVTLLPGAAALLDALGFSRWAIVTSGDGRMASTSLRKAGIRPPRVLVTSDDVTRGKPAPDPYLAAAAQLPAAASDCLVVEDAPAGILSGRAAGMRVLAVATTYAQSALTEADHTVRDLAAVRVEPAEEGIAVWVSEPVSTAQGGPDRPN